MSSSRSPYPTGIETTAFNFCPHCGDQLNSGLAQHKSSGGCETFKKGRAPQTPHAEYSHMPALEDAPDVIPVDESEFEERKELADRLEDEGVWR